MNKKEGIIYALGELKGQLECGKDYNTIKLKDILGEEYNAYEIGFSNGSDSLCVLDTKSKGDFIRGRYVIEIDRHFYIDDLVNLILQGLAFDLKLKKG